jgi:7,8-dihydropterin-6-yl-methyl-4-(beta-D-ribofuranosyl)aminobenzene 5'-phosphate synthase
MILPAVLLLLAAVIPPADAVEITILYNNIPGRAGCVCRWGFACLVRTEENTVLFDTGGEGEVLLHNMELLGVDPAEIDCVVLSHVHGDHTGGVAGLLPRLKPVTWYIPASFAARLQPSLEKAGHIVVSVTEALPICPGVFSTGQLGTSIPEQSLIVETDSGLVVITGCAHPGIVSISAAAARQRRRRIQLILGGFHLGACPEREIKEIIASLQDLGVMKVAPSHCTGERALRLFAAAWAENFLEGGCGVRIIVP